MKERFIIIGCGGVGSWLAPSLCMLFEPDQVLLVDGDTLEEKNLNRQLFTPQDIGRKKSDALAEKYGCQSDPRWYGVGLMEHSPDDWLLVCVDNNNARREALQECDRSGCTAIFAANEVFSSEAYIYKPEWKGTNRDPRVYYPEINTDRTNDPRAAAIGCTGEAQKENRQLVSANFCAAALAQNMVVLWNMQVPIFTKETIERLPYRLMVNMTGMETRKDKLCPQAEPAVPAEQLEQ